MSKTKTPEPDGYFKRGFMGAWDITSGQYIDDLMGREDYKEYEPVCFVPPELLSWVEEVRSFFKTTREKFSNLPGAEWELEEWLYRILPETKK